MKLKNKKHPVVLGISSLVDIFATRSKPVCLHGFEYDSKMLQDDWQAIGNDISYALYKKNDSVAKR